MFKRRKLLILLACGLAIAAVIVMCQGDDEPSYNGRSLTQWHYLNNLSHETPHPAEADLSADAIRHLGTNALPTYFKWLQIKQPTWRNKMDSLVGYLPLPGTWLAVLHGLVGGMPPWVRGGYAMTGFQILGTNAAVAIPKLTLLMNDKSPDVAGQAILSLAYLGKDALPPLLLALADSRNPCRSHAAMAISYMGRMGIDVSPAIPILIQCTQGQDQVLAIKAVQTLGRLRLVPELTIPALAKCLDSPQDHMSLMAPQALARFGNLAYPTLLKALPNSRFPVRVSLVGVIGDMGTNALPAVPELLKSLDDSNMSVQIAAVHALSKIDPSVLTSLTNYPVVKDFFEEQKPHGRRGRAGIY